MALTHEDGLAAHARLKPSKSLQGLEVQLALASQADGPQAFGAALHSYLLVDDVEACVVSGLEHLAFEDCAANKPVSHEPEGAPLLPCGPIDHIYHLGSVSRITRITVETPTTLITVESAGFCNVVVWAPGPAQGEKLDGLPVGDWLKFLCVEAAHVFEGPERVRPVLGPNQSWCGWQRITCYKK